jgi:hypothetical protein
MEKRKSFTVGNRTRRYTDWAIVTSPVNKYIEYRQGTIRGNSIPSSVTFERSLVTVVEFSWKSGEWSVAHEQLRVAIGHRTGNGVTFPGVRGAMTREVKLLGLREWLATINQTNALLRDTLQHFVNTRVPFFFLRSGVASPPFNPPVIRDCLFDIFATNLHI